MTWLLAACLAGAVFCSTCVRPTLWDPLQAPLCGTLVCFVLCAFLCCQTCWLAGVAGWAAGLGSLAWAGLAGLLGWLPGWLACWLAGVARWAAGLGSVASAAGLGWAGLGWAGLVLGVFLSFLHLILHLYGRSGLAGWLLGWLAG